MRTTVRVDDDLLAQAKQFAASTGRTLGNVIEDALRQALWQREAPGAAQRFEMVTFRGDGLQPGVELDDTSSLYDLMDDGAPA